jgi:DNA-binding NarL/FixJ family response regulator
MERQQEGAAELVTVAVARFPSAFTAALIRYMERTGQMRVVAQGLADDELVAALAREHPHVAILDCASKDPAYVAELSQRFPATRLIAIKDTADGEEEAAFVKAGAYFCAATSAPPELIGLTALMANR